MRKSEGKWNLFDTFLVLILILAFVGILFRHYDLSQKLKAEEMESYAVILSVYGIPYQSVDCIQDGAKLYTASGEVYGVLEDHDVKPAVSVKWENGERIEGIWHGNTKCDVMLFLRVNGTVSDQGFLREGMYAVLCGQSCLLYSDMMQFEGVILDFYPISDADRNF